MYSRIVTVDEEGRKSTRQVPEGTPEHLHSAGILVGPPAELDARWEERGWPFALRVRLWNQLHDRGLFTYADVLKNPQLLEGALKASLKADMVAIQEDYRQLDQ